MPPILSLISPILNLISQFFPNASQVEKDKFALQLQELLSQSEMAKAQSEINKVEASNPNLFVAGWRPFVGWICASAFAWQYLMLPVSCWLAILCKHPEIATQLQSIQLDVSTMSSVLMGMLGLGAYRTFEKYNNSKISTK